MKTLASGLPFVTLLLLTTIFSASVSAQKTALQNMPGETVHDVPRPKLTGSDPKPVDATAAILTAFDTYEVVGISAAHGNKIWMISCLNSSAIPLFPGR